MKASWRVSPWNPGTGSELANTEKLQRQRHKTVDSKLEFQVCFLLYKHTLDIWRSVVIQLNAGFSYARNKNNFCCRWNIYMWTSGGNTCWSAQRFCTSLEEITPAVSHKSRTEMLYYALGDLFYWNHCIVYINIHVNCFTNSNVKWLNFSHRGILGLSIYLCKQNRHYCKSMLLCKALHIKRHCP